MIRLLPQLGHTTFRNFLRKAGWHKEKWHFTLKFLKHVVQIIEAQGCMVVHLKNTHTKITKQSKLKDSDLPLSSSLDLFSEARK